MSQGQPTKDQLVAQVLAKFQGQDIKISEVKKANKATLQAFLQQSQVPAGLIRKVASPAYRPQVQAGTEQKKSPKKRAKATGPAREGTGRFYRDQIMLKYPQQNLKKSYLAKAKVADLKRMYETGQFPAEARLLSLEERAARRTPGGQGRVSPRFFGGDNKMQTQGAQGYMPPAASSYVQRGPQSGVAYSPRQFGSQPYTPTRLAALSPRGQAYYNQNIAPRYASAGGAADLPSLPQMN